MTDHTQQARAAVTPEAIEAAAEEYAEQTFYHAWTALPEWARESCRDTARKELEATDD